MIENLPGGFRPRHETKVVDRLPRLRDACPHLTDAEPLAAFRVLCDRILGEGPSAFRYLRRPDPGEEPRSTDHREVFLDVVRERLATHGPGVCVEHTGTNVLGHRDIAAIRNAFMVDIVRDQRDIVASKKSRWQNLSNGRHPPEVARRQVHEKSHEPAMDTWSWRWQLRKGD